MVKRFSFLFPVLVLLALSLEAELVVGPVRWAPLRVALTLPVVFLLPGIVLHQALDPDRDAPLSERILVALGLSLSLLVVGGLLLDLLGTGMRPATWLIYLGLVIIVAEGIALWRRRDRTLAGRLNLAFPPASYLATGLMTAAVIALGFVVAIDGARDQKWPGFSQLWLVAHPGGSGYDLGLANFEGHRETYTVELYDGPGHVRRWGPINAPAGKEWSVAVQLQPYAFAQAVLYRSGASTPYRLVYVRHAVP